MIHKLNHESTDHYKAKQVFQAGNLMTEEDFIAKCEEHNLETIHCDNELLGEPNSICGDLKGDAVVEWVENPEHELGEIKWSEF